MKNRIRAARRGAIALALWAATSAALVADTYPRQDGVDVEEYVFRLELGDESNALEGLTTIAVRFTRDGVVELGLDLVGPSEGADAGMRVAGVWWADGRQGETLRAARLAPEQRGTAVEFTHAAERLSVRLPEPSSAGGLAFVTVAYSGIPATGLEIGPTKHGERSFFSENWPNRARHWLPTVDHPYDKARSQMVVTAPDHYQVISNGLLVEQTDLSGGRRLTHWRQSVPIATWLNVLGVARFAIQHLPAFEGVPVSTWVYPQDREAGFHDFAYPTHDVLAYYHDQIGPYAYEKLAQVQCNSVGGGMESATAIFYDDDAVTGRRDVRWRNVIIHEIAHHWWGNCVTESDWDDVWLSEGFATYFTLLYREHAYGRDDFVSGLRQARQRVLGFYANRPDYRVVHDRLDDMRQVTTGMQYQKGAWVLHMLRGQLGTETFWRGIRAYYARYYNGNASTADLRREMEEVSGQELGWFFDQWLRQGGVPRVVGEWAHAEGVLRLALRQEQADHQFRLPLELELVFADGSRRRERLELIEREAEFELDCPDAPVELVLDPDTWMLLSSELSPEDA